MTMTSQRKGWLPREGFTLDIVSTIIKQTLLNPTLTLPLYILSQYTDRGRGYALDHPRAADRLKTLLWLGAARYANAVLNRGAQNNWSTDKPDWKKELVVITGGSDGMGRLLTGYFADKGVKVIVLDIQAPLGEVDTSKVTYIKCDVSNLEAIQSAAAEIRSEHGDPTVLLLNAGVINRHSILNTPDHLLRRVFDINTLSHYRLLKEFLPAMVRTNHGMICTTASLAGFVTCPGMVDYNGTKAAAVAFHEGLTAELTTRYNAPRVRTLCICPNFVHTKLADGFQNDSSFANPTLYPETVAQAQFERIWNWDGGLVTVPAVQGLMAGTLRSWPYYLQNAMRNRLGNVMKGVEEIEQNRVSKLREAEENNVGHNVSASVVEVQRPVELKEGDKAAMFA